MKYLNDVSYKTCMGKVCKNTFIDLESSRDFLLAITAYTFVCMLFGSTIITWNTVAINFGLLIAVILISPFFNRGK